MMSLMSALKLLFLHMCFHAVVVAKLRTNDKSRQRSLLVFSPALDVTIADISVKYNNVKGYNVYGCLDPDKATQSKYSVQVQYEIRNSGNAGFIAPSQFVNYAACGTPAILNFLSLTIEGGRDSSGNLYPTIELSRFATCVIDDGNTADAAACVSSGATTDFTRKPSQSYGISQGGSYGVSKTVRVKFPLSTEQFNALSNSAPATLTFTLSVNKAISPNGAAGVVAAVDGSKLKEAIWQATGQGTSVLLFIRPPSVAPTTAPTTLPSASSIICDNIIGPDPGTTSIGSERYRYDQTLARVCLATNVQSIESSAFYNGGESTSISSIYISSSVKTIASWAFWATKLTSVTFAGDIESIGYNAFGDLNQYLSTPAIYLAFPGAVGTIGDRAFFRSRVASLSFGGTVGYIGAAAFKYNAIETVIFPTGLSFLGDEAFQENPLTSVTFLGDIGAIGDRAFTHGQVSSLSFGGTVGYIGSYAFHVNLFQTVIFPAGLSFLGDDAFSLNALTNVTFLGAVATIGNNVFYANHGLRTVYHPRSWAIPVNKFPDGVTFVPTD